MFWDEEKDDNSSNLLPFNKKNYLNLKTKHITNENENDSFNENISDFSDTFKEGMIIPSDWGPGKIVSVDKITGKINLEIEGSSKTFDIFELRPYMQIYFHVYFKDMDLKDRKIIFCENIFMNDTIRKIKKKIANIFKIDENKIILVHKGEKIIDNDKKMSECGLFLYDSILVVINGLCDF